MVRDIRIRHIDLKITLEDGEEVLGILSPEGSQRWGGDMAHIAACVDPMAAMTEALRDGGHFAEED